MKKLKLDLDRLRVDTFETAAAAPPRGTVQGHDSTVMPIVSTDQPMSCMDSWESCAHECYGGASVVAA